MKQDDLQRRLLLSVVPSTLRHDRSWWAKGGLPKWYGSWDTRTNEMRCRRTKYSRCMRACVRTIDERERKRYIKIKRQLN